LPLGFCRIDFTIEPGSAAWLSTFIAKTTAWFARRSSAASVIVALGKTLPHLPKEGLVGGDQHGAPLAADAEELEDYADLGQIRPHVRQVAEDRQILSVELGERGLELLYQVRAPA